LVLGVVAIAGFLYLRTAANTDAPVAGTNLTEDDMKTTFTDLCRVQTLAESDVGQARDLFFGRVHSPLHEIAAAAGEADRAVAARLLEAKNDVERAFNQGASEDEAVLAVGRLLPRTEQALRSVGVTTSTCNPS
jgi:hypothetical protein